MLNIDAAAIDRVLDETALADSLGAMFRDGCEQPVRHHHTIEVPSEPDATLLLMPAWQPGESVGIKVATVFPGANTRGLPAVQANYLLLDPRTGAPLALLDGSRLTVLRTAAASALAARYLARQDAAEMVMVGSGALAPCLIRAHLAARLPRYMLPDLFYPITALPLTANGKADRRRLVQMLDEATTTIAENTPTSAIVLLVHADLIGTGT